MDAHAGTDKAGGVLASSQGNAFRAPAPGAKAGEFAKPAPVMPGASAGVANAGKENASASRGAAATASTSDQSEKAEKRWQVRNWMRHRPHPSCAARASPEPANVRCDGRLKPPRRVHVPREMTLIDVTSFQTSSEYTVKVFPAARAASLHRPRRALGVGGARCPRRWP